MPKLITAGPMLLLIACFAIAQDSAPRTGDAAKALPERETKIQTEKIDLTKSEKVSAAEFKQHFSRVGMAETMRHTEFLGVQDEMAILRVQAMNPLTKKWPERILTIKLADLEKELRATIEQKQQQAAAASKENQVTAPEFQRIYALTGKGPVHDRGSLYIYEYQGQRDGRAVINVKIAGPAGTRTMPNMSIKLADLDQEFRDKLPKPKDTKQEK